ncbi:serine/threonine-protein kinase [Streptomyces boncukensis]|uniref:non-specific serine/threonine protein kinase n=1 Tax=Streptomyces boncukensis TaxID=2711219 RepID=A0A6G4WZF1_9ACTN|nr:serine/threonine-protein kinase [Streptomyces boncukensis]NGO70615.1 protein kinase [Streptomyces boncukensis]
MAGGAHGAHGQIVGGRFELLERLGSGGMGTVWRARDTALHREVALKEVRPDPSLTPDDSEAARLLRERVLREARALARLSDPHVVTIHHIVDEGPYPWLVMELVPGATLQDRLAGGPLEPGEAARLGREVLAALRTAHAAGIQHRDVKPANVLLRANGSAVLTDFGIAALQGSSTLTATGEFLGSPEYIAPERIRGTDDDPAADLWSLGMTLYVCTEGHSPLRRGTTLATLAAVLDDPVPPPVRSGALASVLDALLVRDPAARPDAVRLDAMLAQAEAGRAPEAGPPPAPAPHHPPTVPSASPQPPPGATLTAGRPEPPAPPSRRGRAALVAAAAVVAAALIAGGTYLAVRSGDDGKDASSGTVTTSPTAQSDERGQGRDRDREQERSQDPGPDREETPDGERSGNATGSPERSPSADRSPSPRTTPGRAGGDPVDTWVAQLGSVSKAKGTAARDAMHTSLNAKVGGVRWVDSGDYGSLRSGYWMFYHPGPFDSGTAAADWCTDQGLADSNQCLGRYVSRSAADRVYLCSPDKSEATGRCRR